MQKLEVVFEISSTSADPGVQACHRNDSSKTQDFQMQVFVQSNKSPVNDTKR